jgi:UDP-N-acetylmuramoyl-L-alanyl-D-glutamate--2,6-diaminopimelate ligase
MEAYFCAKAALFEPGVWPVVVIDDDWGRRLVDMVGASTTVSAVGDQATWWASDVQPRPDGSTRFRAHGRPGARNVDLAAATVIPGRFNVANALLALAIAERAGLDPHAAAAAIATATVPGRMEPIDAGQPFLAIVDYSHKPAAVEGALAALRPLTRGRLIVVLGCGGDRDHAKRPLMGAIAAREADALIVTDDNPRSEDPAAIRGEVLAGADSVPAARRGEVHEIGDRAEAIAQAVAMAGPGDTVVVAGKGHETGQEIAGVIHPFDDREVLRAALGGAR